MQNQLNQYCSDNSDYNNARFNRQKFKWRCYEELDGNEQTAKECIGENGVRILCQRHADDSQYTQLHNVLLTVIEAGCSRDPQGKIKIFHNYVDCYCTIGRPIFSSVLVAGSNFIIRLLFHNKPATHTVLGEKLLFRNRRDNFSNNLNTASETNKKYFSNRPVIWVRQFSVFKSIII